jgi:hypothetical protein
VVAILEDDPGRAGAMRAVLASLGVEHVIHDSAAAMNEWLAANLAKVRLLSLDHDLGPSREHADGGRLDPGIGREVADFLAARAPSCPVIVHSSNGPAAQSDQRLGLDRGQLAARRGGRARFRLTASRSVIF